MPFFADLYLAVMRPVPATEVARRAGQGAAVMLKVYDNCADGDEPLMNDRMEEALRTDRGTLETATLETDAAEPATHARHAGMRKANARGHRRRWRARIVA